VVTVSPNFALLEISHPEIASFGGRNAAKLVMQSNVGRGRTCKSPRVKNGGDVLDDPGARTGRDAPGGLTMTSNAENEKRGELAGRADGRCWAEHTTEHDDLRRVAAIEFQAGLDCYKALCDAVDPDNEFSEMEIKRYLFGDESAVLTNEYFAAFIEGARQFFLEGAPKI